MGDAGSKTLGGGAKLAYGFGLSAEGIKNNIFNLFLLFYYQQIQGLDPVLCGVALFIGLCVDAVTDPAVGVWSDSLQSRLGRRHPFMLAAPVPLALCFVALFVPPAGLGQAALFAWLTCFAIGTRFAMTLFAIPHQSLLAELSTDYVERTSLQSLRIVFAWLFGLINAVAAYAVFLKATDEYPRGLLNPDGYLPLALFGAVVMLVATFVSSFGTLNAARRAQAAETTTIHPLTLRALPQAVREAFQSPNYRTVVLGGLLGALSFGLSENLSNYMNTYFWEFTSEQISFFIIIIFLASMTVLASAKRLVHAFGKRRVVWVAACIPPAIWPPMIVAKMTGVLPTEGSKALLLFVACTVFVIYCGVIMNMAVIGSMIADITDEHELRTGRRQEGLLFSANTFMLKASSGLGVLMAGVIVKAAGLTEGATVESVDPQSVQRLAMFFGAALIVLGLGAAWAVSRYRLDRAAHADMLEQLRRKRADGGAGA